MPLGSTLRARAARLSAAGVGMRASSERAMILRWTAAFEKPLRAGGTHAIPEA
jgi:hypothetical protein